MISKFTYKSKASARNGRRLRGSPRRQAFPSARTNVYLCGKKRVQFCHPKLNCLTKRQCRACANPANRFVKPWASLTNSGRRRPFGTRRDDSLPRPRPQPQPRTNVATAVFVIECKRSCFGNTSYKTHSKTMEGDLATRMVFQIA